VSILTAQQHNLGYLVPLKVKSEKRESNHRTKLKLLRVSILLIMLRVDLMLKYVLFGAFS